MIIFPDRIFILIPKCGCNSIMSMYGVNPWAKHRQHIENKEEAVLYLKGDYPHMPVSQIPERFSYLPTEAIVRNPWHRTVRGNWNALRGGSLSRRCPGRRRQTPSLPGRILVSSS